METIAKIVNSVILKRSTHVLIAKLAIKLTQTIYAIKTQIVRLHFRIVIYAKTVIIA